MVHQAVPGVTPEHRARNKSSAVPYLAKTTSGNLMLSLGWLTVLETMPFFSPLILNICWIFPRCSSSCLVDIACPFLYFQSMITHHKTIIYVHLFPKAAPNRHRRETIIICRIRVSLPKFTSSSISPPPNPPLLLLLVLFRNFTFSSCISNSTCIFANL